MKAKPSILAKSENSGNKNWKLEKKGRKSFLLLEVMIAFAIIALCILPLLAPNAWMTIEEKKFLRDLERERYIQLVRAHLVRQFYLNVIPWSYIESSLDWPVNGVSGLPENWPYDIRASVKYKDKEGEETDYYLLSLTVQLTEKNKTPEKTYRYNYLLFAEKKNGRREAALSEKENKQQQEEQ